MVSIINYRIFILLLLFTAAFAQPGIPRVVIDTLIFDESLSFDAQVTVQHKMFQQIEGFKKHYTDLLTRCQKCRGNVWFELRSDSSGMIDSIHISDAGDHIIDRSFLDAVEDQILWESVGNTPRFKVEAVFNFNSDNELKLKIEFLCVIGTILTIPPVAIILFRS